MFQSFIGPADPSLQTTATFAYTTDGPATVTCTLDGVSKPCTSTGATITGLTPRVAPYVFRATATDAAGNTSTIEHSWHVYAATELIAQGVLPSLPRLTATLRTLSGTPVAGQKVTFRRGTGSGGGDRAVHWRGGGRQRPHRRQRGGDLQHQLRRAARRDRPRRRLSRRRS